MSSLPHSSSPTVPAALAAILVLQALVLLWMGQPPICTCGYVSLFHGQVQSAGNSQHLTDWYSFTHVLHGFGLHLLLRLVAPRLPFGAALAVAVGLEAAWEVFENSPVIIDRYRQQALAMGYVGDSVVNSLGDTLAMALGFALARVLPVRATVALAIGLELLLALAIRDNLTLNIVQLVYPLEAVARWQAGG